MTENSKGRQQLEIITDDNHYITLHPKKDTKEKGTSKKSGRQTKVDAKEKGGRQREKWMPKRKVDAKEKSGRQREKRTPTRRVDAKEKWMPGRPKKREKQQNKCQLNGRQYNGPEHIWPE